MQEMKYFNDGNDCDICKSKIMTGRDGTVEDCRRRLNGLSCRFEERDIRTCPVCSREVDREDMYFTKDCHGITFRLVCDDDIIVESLAAGKTVVIDAKTGLVTIDGANAFDKVDLWAFPVLKSGETALTFSDTNARVTIKYTPMWI